MPGQHDYNKAFWLAYCDAIKSQIGGDVGEKTSIWYSTVAQRGPPAGPSNFIDPIYTNMGIYDIGDNLLWADNLFYVPSEQNSYARSLLTYLSCVELGGNPTDAQKLQLATRIVNEQAAKTAYDAQFAESFKQWKAYKAEPDLFIAGTTWYSWKIQNCPELTVAENNLSAASSAVDQMTSAVYGNLAVQFLKDKTLLSTAINTNNMLISPGNINMACTTLSGPDADSILRSVQLKQPVPPPVVDAYRPAYSAPNYAAQVKTWMGNVGNVNVKRTSVDIDFDKGNKLDETNFSHTTANAGVNFDYAPWLSIGATASTDHKDSSMLSTVDQQKTKLKMSWDEKMVKVNVMPGAWDIKNRDYKLKADAPPQVKGLARVVQFVIVSKLGFEVEFDGEAKDEFDRKINDTNSGGGSFRLFGIPIGVNASGSTETGSTTHKASWDKQSGKLSITATEDAGFATIIAVIGEKLDG